MNAFGRELLNLWPLDPGFAYLNHGTVGVTPRHVLDAQRTWIERIERQPAEFMLRRLAHPFAAEWPGQQPPLMRQAAAAVADFVGADADGVALVENITTGANAVLRSLPLEPGDVLALTNHGYGGVNNAVRFVAERAGATVDVIDLPAPGASADQFVAAFEAQLRSETRLVVIDHITSFSALVLPIEQLVTSARAKDVMVLVDGAHVPGQIDLDVGRLAEAGADFYAANLHKWGWTPRSSGLLWVAEAHRSWIHPTVTSWGWGNGLAAEFDLLGTRDPSPVLAIEDALAYRASFGEDKIQAHNHSTCWSGARYMAGEWDTGFSTPEAMIGAMAVVSLPGRLGATVDDAEHVRSHLYHQHRIEVPVFAVGGERDQPDPHGSGADPGLVVRICTQIYNDASDIERLVEAVDRTPEPSR